MAWTLSDEATATKYGTGDLSAPSVDCAAGDLIVVFVGVTREGPYCDGISDDSSNGSYTLRTLLEEGECNLQSAYYIGSVADSTVIVTATFASDASTRKTIIVGVFTPDSGDTVSLDTAMIKETSWELSPWETAQGSTTGDDELCVWGHQNYGGISAPLGHNIPSGTAATALSTADIVLQSAYTTYASSQSNIEGELTGSGGTSYEMEMLCFKAEAAAGGNAPTGHIEGPLVGPMGGPI